MDSALAFAEAALDRGDYSQCLSALEVLARKHSINSEEGQKVRMLMITALMGKGEDKKAIEACRQLGHCKNNEIKQITKQLLTVLESPSLARPANWSIQLPNLELTASTGSNPYQSQRSNVQKKTERPKEPPTGPTRGLSFGFSTFVMVIVIGLTILLSGCVQITTHIAVPGPDRIKFDWEIQSSSNKILPWQIEFEKSLRSLFSEIKIFTTHEGEQEIEVPQSRAQEANLVFQKIFSTATKSAGFELSPPILNLEEKNWLVGVQQDVKLTIDLRGLTDIPGLELNVIIDSSKSHDLSGNPLSPQSDGSHINWNIKQGELNMLEFHQWRWNQLGIGTIMVIILLGVILFLQRVRLQMGFGFPELPP